MTATTESKPLPETPCRHFKCGNGGHVIFFMDPMCPKELQLQTRTIVYHENGRCYALYPILFDNRTGRPPEGGMAANYAMLKELTQEAAEQIYNAAPLLRQQQQEVTERCLH